MRIGRRTLFALGLAATLAACTEDATAPGKCPAFCPPGQVQVIDTVLHVISRDSSFTGYVQPDSAQVMLAANVNGLDSRPIFLLAGVGTRVLLNPQSSSDTTTVAATSVDSATLVLQITRRDTLASNLRISLYRLPQTIDKNSTLAGLAGPFTDSLVRSINVDSVLALPGGVDSTAGDSVVAIDTTRIGLKIKMTLDSAQARFIAADSGRQAFGIRISADSLASVAFTTVQGGGGPIFTWWATFDSAGTAVHRIMAIANNAFNSFVSNAAPPTLDSNLVIGGVPSARALLRFAIPNAIRDSSQVVRATLYLVPVTAPVGVPSDSVVITLSRVSTDIGAKSPCVPDPLGSGCLALGDSAFVVSATAPMGRADTIATDITQIVRGWAADTIAPQTLMVGQYPEGGNLVYLRVYSSRSAFRPALHITYVPRYSFGSP